MCDFCTWVNTVVAKAKVTAEKTKTLIKPPRRDPVVVVHGGAGRIPEKHRRIMLNDVKTAAIDAYTNLIRGSHALDAVEEAICHMESRKYFNCAFGGSLDRDRDVVTDAGIMYSSSQVGCVGAVRDIEHPISLARLVLHNTDHILIVEKGAQSFATESGIPILPPGSLIPGTTSPSSLYSEDEGEDEGEPELSQDAEPIAKAAIDSSEELIVVKRFPQCSPYYGQVIEEKYQPEPELSDMFEPTVLEVGGVGAVAYDRRGRLATGTSTAGDRGKLNGYVSPAATVAGCGIFANENGCVSVSGHDRAIYAYAPSRMFVRRLDRGEIIEEALNAAIDQFQDATCQSNIGAIAIDSNGKPAVSFRSQHFPWAYCELGQIYYGCEKSQVFSEKIEGLDRPLDCMCQGVI